jgi:hypothetical protein
VADDDFLRLEQLLNAGYHEHQLTGTDIRLAVGEARQLAVEIITFRRPAVSGG